MVVVLVVGWCCWLLVVGCYLLVVDCYLLVVGLRGSISTI